MKSRNIKCFTLLAFFVAVQFVLTYSPLGFLRMGPISATTLHIPVILAGLLLGPKYGAIMGFMFGFSSFINATMTPGPTSFLFTPFYQVGNIGGNYCSLIIAFVPRILLGYLSGKMFMMLKMKNMSLKLIIVSALNTMIHTGLVLSMIYIFFHEQYAQAIGVAENALIGVLMVVVATNGIMEMIMAAIVDSALYKATYKQVKRMIG